MKIVAIGGGTGMPALLRGLKCFEHDITAIVTMFDDGGGSGVLRQELGMLPPGDIRNCILALSDAEPLMEEVLKYRFPCGSLKNQNFGNLMLAAMNGVTGSFSEAVKSLSDILAIQGRVLPVTTTDAQLCAEFSDGNTVVGESLIPAYSKTNGAKILRVFLDHEEVFANPEAISAISEADAIVISPGSLYTSILPVLLLREIREAMIAARSAKKIYVCNVMTQNGETDDYDVADHLNAIANHIGQQIIDVCLVNHDPVAEEILCNYRRERATVVSLDEDRVKSLGVRVLSGSFATVVEEKQVLRHNSIKIAEAIDQLLKEQ